MASVVLWVRGRGRVEGWDFYPSAPSGYRVQWIVSWDDDGCLSIDRNTREEKIRQYRKSSMSFSYAISSRRWNPLPAANPLTNARVAAVKFHGKREEKILRTKPVTALSFLGIQYIGREPESGRFADGKPFTAIGEYGLKLPLLYLFVFFAVLPAAWLRRAWRQRRRFHVGMCAICGYDLRATNGRCPECGTAIPITQ